MDPLDVSVDERHQRCALEERRVLHTGHVAEGGVDVEVADHRVDYPAAREALRAAHDEDDAGAAVVQGCLRLGERQTVVRGADDERPVRQPALVKPVEDSPDSLVE